MAGEAMDLCLRVLKESNKSRFDNCSVMNSVLIISHITFRDCRLHIFPTTFLEIAVDDAWAGCNAGKKGMKLLLSIPQMAWSIQMKLTQLMSMRAMKSMIWMLQTAKARRNQWSKSARITASWTRWWKHLLKKSHSWNHALVEQVWCITSCVDYRLWLHQSLLVRQRLFQILYRTLVYLFTHVTRDVWFK